MTTTWWREGGRIHVRGSFGGVVIRRVPVENVRALDRVAPALREGVLQGGDDHGNDLHYVLLGSVGVQGVDLEIPVLEAVERALAESLDLSERQIAIRARKLLHGDLKLDLQLVGDGRGERVELPSGVVGVHRVIPFAKRLALRARAAARHRLVDDLLAARESAA